MFRFNRGTVGSDGSNGLFLVDFSRDGSKLVEGPDLCPSLTGIPIENGTKSLGNWTCQLLSGITKSCRSTC